MSNVYVLTATNTYTIVDVRRVFENFEADLRMVVRRTGTRSEDWAIKTASDVLLLAGGDYLAKVSIVLQDQQGTRRAMQWFQVEKDAGEWESSMPGGNRWPRLDSASLQVVVEYNDKWANESPQEKDALRSKQHHNWGASNTDTSEAGMSRTGSRQYGSNSYGLHKINFRSD